MFIVLCFVIYEKHYFKWQLTGLHVQINFLQRIYTDGYWEIKKSENILIYYW